MRFKIIKKENNVRACLIETKRGVLNTPLFMPVGTQGAVKAVSTDELKAIGYKLAEEAGADFIKTSTGFAGGGATIEDLKLMRKTVSGRVQIKAAGGVRDLNAALKVREVGGTRFGATRTQTIMEECYKRKGKNKS